MMQNLPDHVEQYKQTPTFTEVTVPAGFLKEHSTKAGTWGLLTVASGSLKFTNTEPGYEEEFVIEAGKTATITPQHRHFIKPLGKVTFHLEFYR